MFREEILISPNYKIRDYTELDLRIDSDQETWDRAIDIFKDRIEGRFLLLIQELSDKARFDYKSFEYSFSSIALCCLLIETLFQFYKGLNETRRGYGWQGMNKDAFKHFFRESEYFSPYISDNDADIFYKDIRCGILHQAQTKRNSQLTIHQDQMVHTIENGIRVDIGIFTDALIQEYELYVSKIKNGQINSSVTLRENFIRKMNYITTTV
ncbi:hypothetical protein [Paenibacillus sp. P22]|uniref:hypothetical protein n=1 Tax=Paenibacillus sp. P22 TaxID=483908 RepID=UPI000432DF9F|nr:hypothetical protein [Paenibacillus sp. P22]CDN42956.1 Putative uncharacterized protein [Paenibacillus sp. P22]